MKIITFFMASFLLASYSFAETAPPCEAVVKAIANQYPQEQKYTIMQRPSCEGGKGKQTLVYEYTTKNTEVSRFETEEARQSYVDAFKPVAEARVCDASQFKDLMKHYRIKFVMSFQSTNKKYNVGTYDVASCKKTAALGADIDSKMQMSMDACKIMAANLSKKMPQQIDEMTTRKSVSCRRGFTKETALIFNDEIKSDKSPAEWRAAMENSSDGMKAFRKQFCGSASAKTLLKSVDVVLSYKVDGEKVGELPVSQDDCVQ